MSRRSRTRHRRRKARRQAIREGRAPVPKPCLPLRPEDHDEVHGPVLWRDPRTRWQGLRARGGHQLSFHPTGLRMAVDFEQPDAAESFSAAVLATLTVSATIEA